MPSTMGTHVSPACDKSNGGITMDTSINVQNNEAASPSSNSSGDTLRDDGSSEPYSPCDTVISRSSPMSPKNLKLQSLTINDSTPRKDSVQRYSNPFLRGAKQFNEASPYDLSPRDTVRKDVNIRSSAAYAGRFGPGGARNVKSHTWISPDAQATQEFMVIRNSMRRLFKHSEVAKWKLNDYIAHRQAMVASQANQLKEKVEARTMRSTPIPVDTQHNLKKWGLQGNFDERGNLGRVLGEPTIWCTDWLNGKDEIAPWPSAAEMKWEGDDRAKTGVGRFLPLPREEGPPSLQWNQLPVVDQYPMDLVAKIPTMEDVYLPVDYKIEPEKEYLWSKKLEEEMDEFLES